MKFKKPLALFLCAVLTVSFSFTSCKKKDSGNSGESQLAGSDSSEYDESTDLDASGDIVDSDDISGGTSTDDSANNGGTDNGGTSKSNNSKSGGNSSTGKSSTTSNAASGTSSQGGVVPSGFQYPDTPGNSKIEMPAIAKNLSNPTVKIMCSSFSKEENERVESTFKTLTGKEIKLVPEIVDWSALTSTLATRVSSGKNVPDMFSIGSETAPYLSKKSYFRPIQDYINMNDALWTPVKEVNYLGFGKDGKQYAISPSVPGAERMLVYNKTLFTAADLPDPYTQYLNGKWDWDALQKAVNEITSKKVDEKTKEPEVIGLSIADYGFGDFCRSTGKDYVTFGDKGIVISNLEDANFQRAADIVKALWAKSPDQSTWTYQTRFAQNKIGMVLANPWITATEGPIQDMKKAGKLGFVPMPKDPKADKHYIGGSTNFYFIPNKCANPEGAAALISYYRYGSVVPNPAVEAKSKKTAMETWGWTEAEYNFIYKQLGRDGKVSFVFSYGDRVPDFSGQNLLWGLPRTMTWSQTKSQVKPSFDAAIKAFNSSIS